MVNSTSSPAEKNKDGEAILFYLTYCAVLYGLPLGLVGVYCSIEWVKNFFTL
ncbi:MAG: hypothetical protein PHS53_04915 [Candidatus Pacebacteria bacterium]|nr:hypothetical protein [Candidatus Paceibacterota bacterium]MDD5357454.1 hypothetical protein [Candidatus Paceibacterota bacterium]